MINSVDLVALGILLFALWDGWRVGLVRSALSPFCFLCFIPIAVINYDLNKNIAVATLVLILGTLISASLIRIILFITRRDLDKTFRQYVFWGSRLLGSIASAIWKETIFMAVLLLLSLFPAILFPGQNDIEQKIMFSQTYTYFNTHLFPRIPRAQNIFLTLSVFKDPAQIQKLTDTKEFAAFFKSEKVQALVRDEGVKSYLAGKNYVQLLAHPRVRAVLSDDNLMRTLAQLSKRIYEKRFHDWK